MRDIQALAGPLIPGAEGMKSWCPGWDLNPHSRCRKRDFKSFVDACKLLQN